MEKVIYKQGELVPTNVETKGDKIIITHTTDARAILKANKEDRANTDEIWKKGETMKLAARIPMAVWLGWEKEGITQDNFLLLRKIEKYQEYKTTTKRLI